MNEAHDAAGGCRPSREREAVRPGRRLVDHRTRADTLGDCDEGRSPWDEANKKHRFRLALIDADGHPVTAPTSGGDRPVEIAGEFEAGRPAGLKAGSPLDVVVALNIGPLPLQADSRYVWRCWIDEQTREDWEVGFSTRAKGR
jgi:hypothetical protein